MVWQLVIVVHERAGRRHGRADDRDAQGARPPRRHGRPGSREGQALFRQPRATAVAMAAGTISWAAQIAGIWAALEAFHIHVGLAGAGLVFVSSTIVQLFPFWPGNLGIFQLGVAGPLVSVYAISTANAVAFSVGLQLVEGLLGVGLGLFFLAREGLSLSGARRLASAEDDAGRLNLRPARSARRVPDGLDVVAVGIEHERAVVALAVLRRAGRARRCCGRRGRRRLRGRPRPPRRRPRGTRCARRA